MPVAMSWAACLLYEWLVIVSYTSFLNNHFIIRETIFTQQLPKRNAANQTHQYHCSWPPGSIKQQNEWYALTRDIAGKWQKLTELSMDMNLFSWLLLTEIDLLLSLKFANLQIIHSAAHCLARLDFSSSLRHSNWQIAQNWLDWWCL
jgi:hypothetical protein